MPTALEGAGSLPGTPKSSVSSAHRGPPLDLRPYLRFLAGLPGFFRQRLTLAEAKQILRERMDHREDHFLRLVERGIYGHGKSPYLVLLRRAGCEVSDLQQMVRTRGLEATLHQLRTAGVYVTFEEFKGRKPIVRGGWSMPVDARDFDNPFAVAAYHGRTGGTTGPGTRVVVDLEHLRTVATRLIHCYDAYGCLGAPSAGWFGTLPDSTGIGSILTRSLFGNVPERWFSPLGRGDVRPSLVSDAATQGIVWMGRVCGVPLPRPERVPIDEAATIARWMARRVREYGKCLLTTQVSKALRVALAAESEGIDLTGAVFWAGGEPPTPAKVQYMTRVGAQYIPSYWLTETGILGTGCTRATTVDDVHFFSDGHALIRHPRATIAGDIDAFCVTSLSPSTPKLLFNTEIDDYGSVERRSCGCPFEQLGLTDHITGIRSFSKLSTEGMTLVGSEMTRILEEVLPARFGGTPQDYQLAEEENAAGLTILALRISPRVTIESEQAVRETVFVALAESSAAADIAQAMWRQAGSLQVRRTDPIWTAGGKLLPLDLTSRPRAAAAGNRPR